LCYSVHPGGGTIRDVRRHLHSDLADSGTLDEPSTSDSEHTVWTRDPEERTVPVALYVWARRARSDLDESTKPSWLPSFPQDDLLDSQAPGERTVQGLPPSAEETTKLPVQQGQTVPKIRWLSEAVTHKLPAVIVRPRKKKRRLSEKDELAMTAAKSGLAGLAVSAALTVTVLAMVLLGLV
jgi:hypothetical protein